MIISVDGLVPCGISNKLVSSACCLAIVVLREKGPDRFGEAASYLSRYELYDEAFKIYAGDEERLPVGRITSLVCKLI